ncbi:hypothetical protein ACU14_10720 [Xanthomonas oryzae pv. oryzicola]|nr:hypothetical protein ACU13_10775 [Xanthomonas oryzae pv. oryzicola]AKO12392.1 hypothetical protein ACU14_10720 [Xanthomonas oryzae pv. oryzicola]AKO16139.1 hypothetical protein ACU12_10765 [Xanthomonas oryzae pv. oryzicola]
MVLGIGMYHAYAAVPGVRTKAVMPLSVIVSPRGGVCARTAGESHPNAAIRLAPASQRIGVLIISVPF